MSTTIDPALAHLLSLPSTPNPSITLSSHASSGFTSTSRLTTPTATYFIKTSSAPGAEVMFAGEHASLNAIHSVVSSLCPKSFGYGKFDESEGWFLVTEFLDLSTPHSGRANKHKGSGMSLAAKLAKLHTTPVPIPKGQDEQDGRVFGFDVVTCCGDTPQRNTFCEDWAAFFGRERLGMILERAETRQGRDQALSDVIDGCIRKGGVVERLLGKGHLGFKDDGKGGKRGRDIVPVVVHGDLWSGNHGRGRFLGRSAGSNKDDDDGDGDGDAVEEVVFDPSVCYAHSEYELGIMKMFGGFGRGFWEEYHSLVPKTEPVEEFEDRVGLYEAYHHLNHYAIFGGGYKGSAMRLLQPLVKKYGEK